MAPKYSTFGGGYQVMQDKINRTQLPDKLKCIRCKKMKQQSFFSNKQLNELRVEFASNGDRAFAVVPSTCRTCTASQVSELHCVMCDITKGLQDFAKTQRRNPDGAKCKVCMDRHLNTEPGDTFEDARYNYESEDSGSNEESNARGTSASGVHDEVTDDQDDAGVSLDLNHMSIHAKGNGGSKSMSSGLKTSSHAPAGWIPQPKYGTSSQRSNGTSTFDTSAYRQSRGPASVSASVRSGTTIQTARSGWAKPPKAAPAPQEYQEVSESENGLGAGNKHINESSDESEGEI